MINEQLVLILATAEGGCVDCGGAGEHSTVCKSQTVNAWTQLSNGKEHTTAVRLAEAVSTGSQLGFGAWCMM